MIKIKHNFPKFSKIPLKNIVKFKIKILIRNGTKPDQHNIVNLINNKNRNQGQKGDPWHGIGKKRCSEGLPDDLRVAEGRIVLVALENPVRLLLVQQATVHVALDPELLTPQTQVVVRNQNGLD